MINWIDPLVRKPEGEVFWALTEGRNEQGQSDWVIRKLWNDDQGDYRSLDSSSSYRLPHTCNGQHWAGTIYAWAMLEDIPVNEKLNME